MPDENLEAVARALAPSSWAALGTGDTLAHKSRRKASLRHARIALLALAEMDLPDVVVGLAAYEASCECAPAEAAFRAMCRVLASKAPLPASA